MTNTSRPPFIGIGTGRCGTLSLMRMLRECENTYASHEAYLTHWFDPDESVFEILVNTMRNKQREGILFGDISLNNLPRVDYIKNYFPDMKIIHIYRDKFKVVRSFTHAHYGVSRVLLAHREAAEKDVRKHHPTFETLKGRWEIFPVMNADTTKESYSLYYDFYRKEVEKLKERYEVYDVDILKLNKDDELHRLFDYLEIPIQDRVLLERRRYNIFVGGKYDASDSYL